MKSMLICFVWIMSLSIAQSDHTFMTYNLLNYQDENDREDDFITILNFVVPDLIIAEEVVGQTGFNHFMSDVLEIVEAGAWSGADFTNQSATQDIALFYRHDVFSFISTQLINTAQSSGTRDVVEWVMKHNDSGVQFKVYGVHLKASSGTTNAQQRLTEVTLLRNYLNTLSDGSHFIVAGDFNIYSNSSSSEPAFDMLTGSSTDNSGRLYDPIDRIGHWHNNGSFADVHTQSSRGGSYGGLDDRFDWIFVSDAVLNDTYEMNYADGTYWSIGNDGNHFNQAINDGNNASVNDAVANALHDASDHLPVKAVFTFPGGDPSPYQVVITEAMINPGAVSDTYGEWFEIYNNDSVSIDLTGWQLADSDNDLHLISPPITPLIIQPGDYFVLGRNGDSSINGGYTADYQYSGFQLSNSEDEIKLIDQDGFIADEISYTSSFPFSSGASMYLRNVEYDHSVDTSWAMSEFLYGSGDFGTPGRAWNDTTSVGLQNEILYPDQFIFYPAYPNPFNPITTIRFSVKSPKGVSLKIYDLSGKLVKTLLNGTFPDLQNHSTYEHAISWNASNLPSGVYFVQLSHGSYRKTQKVILVK